MMSVALPVGPGVPGVVAATCTGGVVVPPTVTLPSTGGVTYSMEPADPGDGTAAVSVTVTAVLADGFEWGQLGGWVRVDATTATLTLELVGASCEDVTPAAPELTQAVCADGVLSEPSLVLAETDDVDLHGRAGWAVCAGSDGRCHGDPGRCGCWVG